MALLSYVNDGPRTDNVSWGNRDVHLPGLKEIVQQHGIQYRYVGTTPPVFNTDKPSLRTNRGVVTVEAQDDTSRMFPKTGFYYFDMTTEEADEIFASVITSGRGSLPLYL